MTFRVRLLRPFGSCQVNVGDAVFSTELAADEADALLCEWDVYEELFTFAGPSAWYTAEARENPRYGVLMRDSWAQAISRARPQQLLYPAHPHLGYRVPHVTHLCVGGQAPYTSYDGPRLRRAAAVIGNAGGARKDRWPDVILRNRFATAKGVDLYGPQWVWSDFQTLFWIWKRSPAGYQGEAEEAYLAKGIGTTVTKDHWPNNVVKVGLFARYHSAICLENTVDPYYFTEKFVDGVLAGCVPIYRAHPTVRDGVLRGARWVDPADFDLSVSRTLAFALSLDRKEVAEQNRAWLGSDAVRATEWGRVWARIADILQREPPRQRP